MERKWWLVIVGCITHAVNTGLSYFGMSAYFPSFEREFGWSRTAISGAFSLARIESGLLGPIEGYVTDRVGPQRMIFIGLFLCAGGFLALSLVDSLPMLYVVIVLSIVLGSSLGYNMPISVLIAKVFRERRSLAFGIFRMGPGISGPMVPLVGWMIGLWGWRTAAVISGFVLLAVGFPLACVIKKIYSREETGIVSVESSGANSKDSAHSSTDPQFTLKQALHHRSFWLLSVAMGMRHLVTEGVSVHFVILLVDRGWSTEAASTLLGISALVGAPARIGMGWLGDLLDKRRLVMGLLLALSVSVLLMGYTAQAVVFTTCMIIYSLAYGGLAALQEPIRADYFGTRAFATIQGMSRSVVTAGTFLGPIIAGFFYDVTKSYTIAFGVFALVSLMATLFMFFAKPPQLACGD
ncbi:MAG TPA: MFS transporter [Candidatus Polarisedimenticolaceae bacterium]|nr:MFS transporter [Candidatus Polarisedimenticolaceae bacterium]